MKIRGVAERGYALQFPENTLSSFQAAINLHFSHTKLEVHLTKDGIPVVIRDATIDRMTTGRGEIQHFTYEELLQYTINHDERIPTLEEVIYLTKGKIKTIIEINQTGFYYDFEEKVYELLHQHEMKEDTLIVSRNHYTLSKLRILSNNIELGLLIDEPHPFDLRFMQEIKASYYYMKFDIATIQKLDFIKLKKLGIQLIIGPVNTIEKMKLMQQYPEVLVTTTELEKYQAICYPKTITDWQKVGI
ncbi:glycerophosphodiester phosphodiesterase [Oceanobacillus luteolus]|uniref:glycerophosphodiester phosphodiesterase n=1 Tax=Oceanobacillus luteolus TaxID=1274358 RepID=UPI00203C51F4|nr:glycerophosphodiester phosphodiesterase family protein [Oceanobacillus luteolus]